MALRRKQAEAIVKEALERGRLLPSIDYHSRARIEALCLLPGMTNLFKRLLERWWLSVVRTRHAALSPDQVAYAIDLMLHKNLQYGCTQLYTMGTMGILLRSLDKAERLKTIEAGVRTPLLENEGYLDSQIDLFNYSILAVLVLRKELT